MIRYQYSPSFSPPAPCVHVMVRDPDEGKSTEELPCLLDSGADRTVVPGAVVRALGLAPVRRIQVAGLGGEIQNLETYLSHLTIRNLQTLELEVLAHENESFVLLGRDAMNQLRVVLDGPQQVVEIG
jgi:predicted aspartyl protease